MSDRQAEIDLYKSASTPRFPLILVLDNIRSAYNVGAMLRLADCAGIAEVITCGYTPQATHPKVKKTSLDAEQLVKSRHFTDLATCIETLTAEGIKIYALEKPIDGSRSHSLWDTEFPLPTSDSSHNATAFIVGNEVEGVQTAITSSYKIDTIEIPQFGFKESLNVASAAAILVYDIIKRWGTPSKVNYNQQEHK